jgi:hypothetical protein
VLFHKSAKVIPHAKAQKDQFDEETRAALLKVINTFTPTETVFEVAHKAHKRKGSEPAAVLMKERRRALKKAVDRAALAPVSKEEPEEEDEEGTTSREVAMADEDDIAVRFDEYFISSLSCSPDGHTGGLRCSIFKEKPERKPQLQGLGVLYVICPEGR